MELANNQPDVLSEMNDPMMPSIWRIKNYRTETADTFTIDLVNEHGQDGMTGMHFQPGQFNMLYLFGAGESAISISGDPRNKDVLTHTVRAVGTVTRALARLKRGDVIGVRGPYGSPWPVVEAIGNDVLIVAGGIGLAPLRPVIYHLIAEREKYGKVTLLYGARSPVDILFRQELEKWRGRFDMQVEATVDNARQGQTWHGNAGVVTGLIPRAGFDPSQTTVMICGPELMMRFTIIELQKRGIEEDAIHVSMERNMKCAIGLCGHCQLGPEFICKNGPVFRFDRIRDLFRKREI
ncbi:MAG: FAD/NAD(P)-binding protein [Acidobacteria bacterium]|nr:FAD/NAD(P)-binding protein [Acidobacteriota bacterium]